ncbi:MAG: sugar phosphate isomerase/epimerase [Ruminococcaceae bacterium]|nr:sugar phosphate isomerase/epimerase [Oscillospiraceae bacterium]
MKISTTTYPYCNAHGTAEAIRLIANAGFDCYDYSVFDISENNPLYCDGWRDYIADLRRKADALGIACNQAHAPFPTSKLPTPSNEAYNDTITDKVIRSMEAAAMLGAKAIVVHPKQHLDHWDHIEDHFRINMEFYRSLAPYAKQFGIKIALENMWRTRDGKIVESTCSSAEEFNRYFDTLADDCFTCCLDLGHCGLTGFKAEDMIRAMGKRIGTLHVHDNDDFHDSHTLPFNGKMNWEAITQALGEIGYEGDFTYETTAYQKKIPDYLMPDALSYMEKMARRLCEQIDAAR